MDRWRCKKIVDPSTEQLSEITNGLKSFGLEQTGGEAPARVAVVYKQRAGDVIGGAVGHSIRRRFFLTQLWVAEEYRSRGIGAELVDHMERVATERGCHDLAVDTLNEKAISFYERLGYRVYLINPNYIQGFDWYFLSKPLDLT